jgi:hypothetical protein
LEAQLSGHERQSTCLRIRVNDIVETWRTDPAMGWFVKGEFDFSFVFSFCGLSEGEGCVAFWLVSSGRAPASKPGLTCYPYILCGVHYIVSNPARGAHRDQSLRRAIQRPRGRYGLRYAPKVSCYFAVGGFGVSSINFAGDRFDLPLHALSAARGIGLCRSATRAPGRPWIADASGPVPATVGAGLLLAG